MTTLQLAGWVLTLLCMYPTTHTQAPRTQGQAPRAPAPMLRHAARHNWCPCSRSTRAAREVGSGHQDPDPPASHAAATTVHASKHACGQVQHITLHVSKQRCCRLRVMQASIHAASCQAQQFTPAASRRVRGHGWAAASHGSCMQAGRWPVAKPGRQQLQTAARRKGGGCVDPSASGGAAPAASRHASS